MRTINEANGDNESDDDEDETTIGQILSDLPTSIKLPPWMSKSYDALKNERLNSGMKIKNQDDYTSQLQGKSSIFDPYFQNNFRTLSLTYVYDLL